MKHFREEESKSFWQRRLFLLVGAILLVSASLPEQARGQGAVKLLQITEVYYDTPGRDEEEEWIELVSLSDSHIEITNYRIGDEEQEGGTEGMVRFPAGATLEPGEVIVIARHAVGFHRLFGVNPDYEIQDSDPVVPNMLPVPTWARGEVALANDGDEVLLLAPDNSLLDALSYGDSRFYFSPSLPDVLTSYSVERVGLGCDSDTAVDWNSQPSPSPGRVLLAAICPEAPPPTLPDDLLPIGTIQGSDEISPYHGETVSFLGIVSGLYEDRNSEGTIYYTLFVQDVPEAADNDPATSDGIAVFLGTRRPTLALGDKVLVEGKVLEYYGLTEIDDNSLRLERLSEGNTLPPAINLESPPINYEPLEGMRVSLDGARVVAPTFSGCSFFVVPPALNVNRVFRRSAEDSIAAVLPILHYTDVDCRGFAQAGVGDRVSGLEGPLIYHFEQYKIVQQQPETLTVEPVSRYLSTPLPLGPRQFSVATFNLENYFDQVNDTGMDAEPLLDQRALSVKQNKLALTITDVLGCPTILGVQEVENEALLQALVELLAGSCGFRYTVSHLESADARGIDVALLSHSDRVQVLDVALRQSCTEIETGIADPEQLCSPAQDPLFSRPPLYVETVVDGVPYSFFVNHFKSKLGGEIETAPRRLAQARHVAALVQALQEERPDARVVVMGDLNDYILSPPLLALIETGPLVNVLLALPAEEQYSYTFSGAAQLFDYLLLSPTAAEDVTTVAIQRVNADYPYGLFQDPEVPTRVSDHDIPLIVLALPQEPIPVSEPVLFPTSPPVTQVPTTSAIALVEEPEMAAESNPLVGTVVVLVALLLLATGALIWALRR